jgi:hypothetical protein
MSGSTVTFDDGSSRHFDAIVAATGFRPGVERFLETHRNAHSDSRGGGGTGLHFCGFLVTPTGMFREIAIEARCIAHHITATRGRAGR